MTRAQLAEAAGVSEETVKRLEGIEGDLSANLKTVTALQIALERKGVLFVPANGGPAGVRFKNAPESE
jgi:hypothetical protein